MGSVEVRSWPPHLRKSQARRNHSAASRLPSQERKTIQPDAPWAATAVTDEANVRSERSGSARFERGGRKLSTCSSDGRERTMGRKRCGRAYGGIAAGLRSGRDVHGVRMGEGLTGNAARRDEHLPATPIFGSTGNRSGGNVSIPPATGSRLWFRVGSKPECEAPAGWLSSARSRSSPPYPGPWRCPGP